ncbi:Hsp70 nucleotide exchange factor fes1 [Hordeum vulgare]|nr:Hsp70 nucleotide exchange factor fes1 [Hordeum vulgare]
MYDEYSEILDDWDSRKTITYSTSPPVTARQAKSEATTDSWLWSFGKISEDGLFHFGKRSCKGNHILGSNSVDVGLQKKAVFLLTDLADFQLNSGNSGLTFVSERFLLKSVTDMLSEFDLDLQEKVLLAIRSLLKLPSTDARDFKSCGLDSVLYRLGVQLEELPSEEQKEYAREVDALRREVLMFFEQKLKLGTAATAVS